MMLKDKNRYLKDENYEKEIYEKIQDFQQKIMKAQKELY